VSEVQAPGHSRGLTKPQRAQRTFEIWSFAFKFFFRLWLVGKKFSYGKAVRARRSCSARCAVLCYVTSERCPPSSRPFAPAHLLSGEGGSCRASLASVVAARFASDGGAGQAARRGGA